MRKGKEVTKEEFDNILKPLSKAKLSGKQYQIATGRGALVLSFVKKANSFEEYRALNTERSQRLKAQHEPVEVNNSTPTNLEQRLKNIEDQLNFIGKHMFMDPEANRRKWWNSN